MNMIILHSVSIPLHKSKVALKVIIVFGGLTLMDGTGTKIPPPPPYWNLLGNAL
jgi:hypothetical protein